MAESKNWTFVNAVFMCFIAYQVCKVKGNSCRYTNELIASIDPSVTTFKKTLDEPYDHMFERSTDGLECTWTIQASSDDRLVRLNFITFHMMNDTATKNGDCVAIYDGDQYDTDDRQELIQELCSRMPEAVYNSTGQYLSVVFRQGDHGGLRWMTMNYTAVDSSDDHDNGFWTTTFGRALSFIIVITLLSIFSFLCKAWKQCTMADICNCCCDALRHCLSRVRRLASQCADDFRSRTGGAESASSRGEPSQERPCSTSQPIHRTSDVEGTDTDIVTISGSNGSAPGPDLSSHFSGQWSDESVSYGADLGGPPPDYSTVLAHSALSSMSSETSDGVRQDEDTVPMFSSAVSPTFHSDSQDSNHQSALPPPPDDGTAPPLYELPAPPSYESLFNSTDT